MEEYTVYIIQADRWVKELLPPPHPPAPENTFVEKSEATTEKQFFLTFIYSFVPDLLVFHLQLGGGKGKSTTPKHSTPL